MTALVECSGLHVAYDDHVVLRGVDLTLSAGEVLVVVGPNGAGKSTLLSALLGIVRAEQGVVKLGGRSLEGLRRAEVAKRVAYVPQDARADFAFTVRELVSMGRTPHLGRFQPERPEDVAAVDHALDVTSTRALEHRPVSELSGGERKRVHIARAIAQTTETLLLDEPTAALDVEHQLEVLDLVRELSRAGKGALVALHDLSLAARYGDRVVVVADRRIVASGVPREVLTEELLATWFHIRGHVHRDPDGGIVIVPLERIG